MAPTQPDMAPADAGLKPSGQRVAATEARCTPASSIGTITPPLRRDVQPVLGDIRRYLIRDQVADRPTGPHAGAQLARGDRDPRSPDDRDPARCPRQSRLEVARFERALTRPRDGDEARQLEQPLRPVPAVQLVEDVH